MKASRKSPALDFSGIAGAGLMALFGCVAIWRWHSTSSLFFALLAFRDFVAAYYFSVRGKSKAQGSKFASLLAYASTAMPLLYRAPIEAPVLPMALAANLLFILGFLISTLATIELGSRMGVSPAVRGSVCDTGIYRWIRHPMYTGYVVAETGWILLSFSNAPLFAASLTGYLLRMRLENRILSKSLK